jgi:hypothetical protein
MIAAALFEKMGAPWAKLVPLSDAEAGELAANVLAVAELHDMTPNPYVMAYGNLLGCASVIYGARYAAYRSMQNQAKQPRPTEPPPPPDEQR